MAAAMPGIERFEVRDAEHWIAHVLVPLGLGGLRMKINFDKTEQRPPEFAKLHAKGEGVGALLNMDTEFQLDEGDGGTTMKWQADVTIAGPVGSMGQRVLQPIVNQQVKSVLSAVDEQVMKLARGDGGEDARAGAAGSTSPRTGEFVRGSEEVAPEASPRGSAEASSWGEASASEMGTVGTAEPTSDRPAPETDPTLRDEGPPPEVGPDADPSAVEGSSGAEEGVSPWEPEAYDPDAPRSSDDSA
jgi:carbon monoxide dehydrogenase subunit G